jgi:ankyrin repeat protein
VYGPDKYPIIERIESFIPDLKDFPIDSSSIYDENLKLRMPVPISKTDTLVSDIWILTERKEIVSPDCAKVDISSILKAINVLVKNRGKVGDERGCYRPWWHSWFLNELKEIERINLAAEIADYLKHRGYQDVFNLKACAEEKDIHGNTALHLSAKLGRFEVARYLLSHGLDVNSTNLLGETPIMMATLSCHLGICELFILNGADLQKRNKDGKGVFHYFARSNWRRKVKEEKNEIARKYISLSVDPNMRSDNGDTAMHICAFDGNKANLEILMEIGANIEEKNNVFRTPLHSAILWGSRSVAKLLLEKGANTDNKDIYRESILDVAESRSKFEKGWEDVVQEIRRHNTSGETK